MDLSVVIVNWNTKKLLENCLISIYKYSKGINFEVIVIDNGSEDDSPNMVKKKFPQVKLILNKRNNGFSKANNQGIIIAKGKYILLLNSDTFLTENSLQKLVDSARNITNLGALGPKLINSDKSIQQSAGFFPNLPQVFYWMSFLDDLPFGSYLKPYHVDHDSFYQNNHVVEWVTGAAILIPKNVLNDVGLLDENIFMYTEEVELCYRITRNNYKVYYISSTSITHIGRGSHRVPSAAFIGEYKGLIYFYEKYRNKISLQILKLLLKMGALVRLAIFTALKRKELGSVYLEAFKVV